MTRQASDILYFEGKQYFLNHYILDRYFLMHPEKKPINDFVSTDMWRGYVAQFEIKDNQLFALNREYNFRELFPNNGKLEWYSGLIRIDDFRDEFDLEPQNGIFEYIEILKGDFIQKRVFDFDGLQKFKNEQYDYFLLSDEVESVYEFWRSNNENGRINIDAINKIVLEDIMNYTEYVYAD